MQMFWNRGISLQIVQGMPLGSLIRLLAGNGFVVDKRYLGRLAYLIGIGVFNSILGSCERFFDGAEIDKIQLNHAPLFILGHWRSGTTHLHNLLSLDNEFSSPNVYQCLFPNHFIYSQVGSVALKFLAPDRRPMDNVSFSSRAPHEEEFALAALSLVSPYLRVIFPLTGHKWHTSLDLDKIPPDWRQAWKDAFIFFLKKLELSEGGRALLKSPPNTARVKHLLEIFPGAHFVHIVRNPYRVYLSTRNLWDKSFAKTRLQEPTKEFVQELILNWYLEMFELFDRDRALIPPGHLHELKFEDLEADPLAELERIYLALNLKNFDFLGEQAVKYLDSIKTYKKNIFDLDEKTKALVAERWEKNFNRYGYEI